MTATIIFLGTIIIGAVIMAIPEAKEERPPTRPMKRINPAIIKFGVDEKGNVMEAYQLDNGYWRDLYNEIDLPNVTGREFSEVRK